MAETNQPHKCNFCKTSSEDSKTNKLLQCSRCKKISYCGTNCQKQDWPSHRKVCVAPNYILTIDLAPDIQDRPGDSITNPSISRTLSCPANATFAHLHEALQTAFGYTSTHSYDFQIKDPNAEPEDLSLASPNTQLSTNPGEHMDHGPKQNLLHIVEFDGPPMEHHIMRSPDVFQTNRRKHSQTPEIAAAKIKLPKVFDNKEYGNSKIEYTYDFGDCWWHIITVKGREPATGRFLCLDGEGHGVAEDAGSIHGWEELKEAYRSESPTEEQRKKIQWFENSASNRDPAGLGNGRDKFWDKEEINLNLGDII